MEDKIKNLKQQFEKDIRQIKDQKSYFTVEKKYLGRNGAIRKLFEEFANIDRESRKKFGFLLNQLKKEFIEKLNNLKVNFPQPTLKADFTDITIPPQQIKGNFNPLQEMIQKVQEIFWELGFSIYDSPHIETDYNNFGSLNMPKLHPARDMWNTFYLESKKIQDELLLRTHTTAFQVPLLKQYKPPFRFVNIGRCFRYEPIDNTHNIEFYQVDGFIVDKNLNLSHFLYILDQLFQGIFNSKIDLKISPSYFPFVEPGFEVAIKNPSQEKYLEIMGAGFTHPNVLKEAHINPRIWRGIAFGGGIERLAMIYYGIEDIRYFYSQDIRILKNIK